MTYEQYWGSRWLGDSCDLRGEGASLPWFNHVFNRYQLHSPYHCSDLLISVHIHDYLIIQIPSTVVSTGQLFTTPWLVFSVLSSAWEPGWSVKRAFWNLFMTSWSHAKQWVSLLHFMDFFVHTHTLIRGSLHASFQSLYLKVIDTLVKIDMVEYTCLFKASKTVGQNQIFPRQVVIFDIWLQWWN